jgi:hypothetical protein
MESCRKKLFQGVPQKRKGFIWNVDKFNRHYKIVFFDIYLHTCCLSPKKSRKGNDTFSAPPNRNAYNSANPNRRPNQYTYAHNQPNPKADFHRLLPLGR